MTHWISGILLSPLSFIAVSGAAAARSCKELTGSLIYAVSMAKELLFKNSSSTIAS